MALTEKPKLRLKYAIHYLSDTEIQFEVIEFDKKNLLNSCFIGVKPWWVCVPGRPKSNACISVIFQCIFLIKGRGNTIEFRSKEHRDQIIKEVKKVLEVWKFKAYGIWRATN